MQDKALELGVNPFEIMLLFAKGDWKSLGYDKEEFIAGYSKKGDPIYKQHVTSDHRLNAASNAAKYLYPQLKAIDVKIDNEVERPLEDLSDEELDKL